MIKSKLIEFETKRQFYKGERYMRGTLVFQRTLLGIIKWRKTIVYDVTMFGDFATYKKHWQSMIDTGANVPSNIIKNRIIF